MADEEMVNGTQQSSLTQEKKGTPRLMITEMVLENFKSYAGVQRVGPFHKSFSSVVGPNGSGKSNVIDAMLFVFGKRAKQLRLNKVSDLIHNSTDYQHLDSAKVAVHFQEIIDIDDEKYEVVPGSQFIISRAAFRNNTSKYFMNNSTSTYTEVTNFLMTKGVDLTNNRFLILQGEVELISMMKPKAQNPHDEGLLEYLEEIIGSNKYVERINEGAKIVEELNEKRGSLVERVKMAEKERDALQESKTAAESYMLKEAQLTQWSMAVNRTSLIDASEHERVNREKMQALEETVETEREKCSGLRQEVEEKSKACDECNEEYKRCHAELEAAHSQFKEFERRDVSIREDYKHCKAKLKKIDDKMAKDKSKLEDASKTKEEATAAIPRLEKKASILQPRLVEAEEKLEEAQEQVKVELEKQQAVLEEAQRSYEPFERRMNEAQAEVNLATTQLNLARERQEAAKKHLSESQASLSEKEQLKKETERRVREMEKEVKASRAAVTAGQQQDKKLKQQESDLRVEADVVRGRVAEMREAAVSERTRGTILSALLKAKQTGAIPGIYGRLGDLGGIDAKYDIAISTACPQLDYVVVDTTQTAQACVELLRTQNLGVATFLILEKQKHLETLMRERVSPPEGVPRLFDLIQVPAQDKRILPAFFFALRHTLVCEDLDQASRIAYSAERRFRRVVTLNGELFESSGTMAGGGGRPRGGRMGRTATSGLGMSSPEAIEGAEQELSEKQGELNAVVEQRREVGAKLLAAEKAVAQLQMELPKAHMEVESLEAQIVELRHRIAALQKESCAREGEEQEIAQLSRLVEGKQRAVEEISEEAAPIKRRVDEIRAKMERVGKERLAPHKEMVEQIKSDLDVAQAEMMESRVKIATADKASARLRKSIAEAEREREGVTGEVEGKEQEMNDICREALEVHEGYERVKKVYEDQKAGMERVKRELNAIKSKLEKMRAGEVEAQLKLEDARKAAQGSAEQARLRRERIRALRATLKQQMQQIDAEGIEEEKIRDANLPCGDDMEEGEEGGVEGGEDNAEGEGEGVRGRGYGEVAVSSKDEALAGERAVRAELEVLKGTVNLSSIAEFRRKDSSYKERLGELEAVNNDKEASRQALEELKKKRLDEFMAGFDVITMKLKEMYQMITLGGDAELELVDSMDPFAEGIVFSVRPPKKSWKNICNLSGGEKTLSSLALVFALHHYKPTPLYVMDEIDAALDFKNVSIVAHYVKERTKNAQFIIISLRNNMFELADHLVGIYKTNNCTKSITIDPRSFVVAAQQQVEG